MRTDANKTRTPRYRGTLKKFHNTGPLLKDDPTEPLRLGAGVGVASSNGDAPFFTASARKRVALLEGPELLLTAKARADFEPASGRVRAGPALGGGPIPAPAFRGPLPGRSRLFAGRVLFP